MNDLKIFIDALYADKERLKHARLKERKARQNAEAERDALQAEIEHLKSELRKERSAEVRRERADAVIAGVESARERIDEVSGLIKSSDDERLKKSETDYHSEWGE